MLHNLFAQLSTRGLLEMAEKIPRFGSVGFAHDIMTLGQCQGRKRKAPMPVNMSSADFGQQQLCVGFCNCLSAVFRAAGSGILSTNINERTLDIKLWRPFFDHFETVVESHTSTIGRRIRWIAASGCLLR